jgi:prepilin-type N-terminal cleavage/methylation domain-containing protein
MSTTNRDAAGEHQREEMQMQDQEQGQRKREQGFTLIELLIAIVVVGILTAVAIVGIAGLTNKGNNSACAATLDAARTASSVYYANHSGTYPSSFNDLIPPTSDPALLTIPSGVSNSGSTLSANSWSITMSGGGGTTSEPTFTATVTGGGNCEGGSGGA